MPVYVVANATPREVTTRWGEGTLGHDGYVAEPPTQDIEPELMGQRWCVSRRAANDECDGRMSVRA